MTDLIVFIGLVGLVVAVGILVGMIVAGRIDRILAPTPAAPRDAGGEASGGAAPAAGHDPTGQEEHP
jgi:hypothetical protein